MANFRGARHLSAALSSVLRQTYANLEVIVCDDASPDDSVAVVRAMMARDNRIRLIEAQQNAGPAAARNRALDAAVGDWIAIVDSDDLMHPQRLERLIVAADRLGADMIADDLIFFGLTPDACGTTLLLPFALCEPLTVAADMFLRASGEDRKLPALGYLKPMIRRARLGAVRYDENLRIGEDFDLVLRLLMSGLRYVVLPDPMYLYRRHGGSISHRLSEAAVAAMLAAHDRIAIGAPVDARERMNRRRAGLQNLARFEGLVAAIRGRKFGRAAGAVISHPPLVLNLGRSLAERLFRKSPVTLVKQAATAQLGVSAKGALAVHCPPVPPAGLAWADPPARMAAYLSRLHGGFDLSAEALDDPGLWAAAILHALTSDQGT